MEVFSQKLMKMTKCYNKMNIVFAVLFVVIPTLVFSQKSETTSVLTDTLPAINLDSRVYQQILTSKYNARSQEEHTFVLYNDKLYPITDFFFQQDEITGNAKSIKIINHPDSIRVILSNRIKSIVVIEDKEGSDDDDINKKNPD